MLLSDLHESHYIWDIMPPKALARVYNAAFHDVVSIMKNRGVKLKNADLVPDEHDASRAVLFLEFVSEEKVAGKASFIKSLISAFEKQELPHVGWNFAETRDGQLFIYTLKLFLERFTFGMPADDLIRGLNYGEWYVSGELR